MQGSVCVASIVRCGTAIGHRGASLIWIVVCSLRVCLLPICSMYRWCFVGWWYVVRIPFGTTSIRSPMIKSQGWALPVIDSTSMPTRNITSTCTRPFWLEFCSISTSFLVSFSLFKLSNLFLEGIQRILFLELVLLDTLNDSPYGT